MGDRANIVVRSSTKKIDDVWFYAHWRGEEIHDVVKAVLARNERQDDAPYLARMIFCELVKGNELDSTGFGISTSLSDNEHDILIVDIPAKMVYTVRENELVSGRLPDNYKPAKGAGKSFDSFI